MRVGPGTPYQLRYTAAAVIREALGLEAAQAILGHTKSAMTAHYAKASEAQAIEAARAGASLGPEFLPPTTDDGVPHVNGD